MRVSGLRLRALILEACNGGLRGVRLPLTFTLKLVSDPGGYPLGQEFGVGGVRQEPAGARTKSNS